MTRHTPPTLVSVTTLPFTLQTNGVALVNATGRPELAVALTVNGGSPVVRSGSGANVIVCADFPPGVRTDTVSVCVAAAYSAFPA